jgi:hypothetical protein
MTGSILLNNNLTISGQLFGTSSYSSMIAMSPSNKVLIDNGSQGVIFGGTIGQGAYTYNLPTASGTLALTSDLGSYLPLNGGTLTGGLYINPTNTATVGLDVASNTTRFRSDNLEGFKRQLEITMGSGTLVQMVAKGFGASYGTDLAFYSSTSGGVNGSPAIYITGTNNRVGIKTGTPAYDLDVSGTLRNTTSAYFATTSGNVGIGTSSPIDSNKLTVLMNDATNGTGIAIKAVNNGGIASQPALTFLNGSGNYIGQIVADNGTGYLAFNTGTSNTERMRITSGGGVYFGTTGGINANINYEFRASKSIGGVAVLSAYNTSTFDASPSFSCYKGSTDTSSNNRFIQFYCNGESQPMGGIVGNGATNVQFASISDIREKENIVSIYDSLNKILALNPVEFDWINTGEHIKAGFVAQQVEEIFPEYVVENMSNDGKEERKGLTGGMSSGIIAHLVKAIQEQNQTIQELSNRLIKLESK